MIKIKPYVTDYFDALNWSYLPNWLKLPKFIYYSIRAFIQRGFRGYADVDVIDLDTYHTGLMLSMFIYFRKRCQSHPADMSYEAWLSIIDEIISGFEAMQTVPDNYDEEVHKALRSKFENSMDLFIKHYGQFWL